MTDYFADYLSDASWHFFETGWHPEMQNSTETLFALGNGYIGSRAILEENPPGCLPGARIWHNGHRNGLRHHRTPLAQHGPGDSRSHTRKGAANHEESARKVSSFVTFFTAALYPYESNTFS